MVTCKKTDWAKGMGVPLPVNEDVATDVLNFLFNTQTWKTNPDLLILRVRKWRERLWVLPTATATEAPTEAPADDVPYAPTEGEAPENWAEKAVRLREEGRSWNQIAAETGRAVGTVRDAVKKAQQVAA